jgi:hypothetical protein
MEELGDGWELIFDPANFIQVGCVPRRVPQLEGYLTYMHIKDALLADGSVVPSGTATAASRTSSPPSPKEGRRRALRGAHLTVFKGLEALQTEA